MGIGAVLGDGINTNKVAQSVPNRCVIFDLFQYISYFSSRDGLTSFRYFFCLFLLVEFKNLYLFQISFILIFIIGIYELVLGEDNQADQARAMQQQMPGGAGQIMDEQKAFKVVITYIKVSIYDYITHTAFKLC